jgi:hypothetical protein
MRVRAHETHVYHEGIGKKGANNVACLIIKTLQELKLLRLSSAGGKLNIIFDNCLGQNKNNTVIRPAAWLNAMNYFREVNFTFLVVGHTKNAAYCLFNCLKTKYHLQNLFTFQDLLEALNRLPMVAVHPTSPVDFHDYDQLMKDLFQTLSGRIKMNHIFYCNNDGSQMNIWRSNLTDHIEYYCNICWRGTWDGMTCAKIANISSEVLDTPLHYAGLNPYKVMEMFQKYRPVVPDEFHSDELYAEPSAEVYLKVKRRLIDQSFGKS